MATVAIIQNVNMKIIYDGIGYDMNGIDSISVTTSTKQGLAYSADGYGKPVVMISGNESPDTIDVVSTVIEPTVAQVLQALKIDKNSYEPKFFSVAVTNKLTGKNVFIADECVLATDNIQSSIDTSASGKYAIPIVGRVTENFLGTTE